MDIEKTWTNPDSDLVVTTGREYLLEGYGRVQVVDLEHESPYAIPEHRGEVLAYFTDLDDRIHGRAPARCLRPAEDDPHD